MHSLAYGNAMMAAVRDYKQVPRHNASSDSLEYVSCNCGAPNSCLHSQVLLVQLLDWRPVMLQDMEHQEAASRQHQHVRDIDIDDLLDDPELERLHAERLATMQKENEKRQQLQRKGHGEYQEVEEG